MNAVEELVMCRVERVSYDFAKRKAIVHVPGTDGTDMTGCIAWVQRIDPDVAEIQVINGTFGNGTAYVLQDNGQWKSVLRG